MQQLKTMITDWEISFIFALMCDSKIKIKINTKMQKWPRKREEKTRPLAQERSRPGASNSQPMGQMCQALATPRPGLAKGGKSRYVTLCCCDNMNWTPLV